jgi:hypothetical protein
MEINEMLDTARLLVKLLEDPHPGLFTWNKAVSETIEKLYTG